MIRKKRKIQFHPSTLNGSSAKDKSDPRVLRYLIGPVLAGPYRGVQFEIQGG